MKLMKLLLVVVACVAVLVFGIEAFTADRPEAINPADVGTVRLFATGQGSLGPPSPLDCPGANCPEHIRVRFDHGPQALRGLLDVPLEIKGKADPFTLCNKLKGTGTLGDLTVEVVGDVCFRGATRYSLSASMQVFDNTNACTCEDKFAAAGQLEMFGAIKGFGPAGPYSIESIATFVGGAGRPAICCP